MVQLAPDRGEQEDHDHDQDRYSGSAAHAADRSETRALT